jgi:N-methylhydantoinase A
MSPEAVGVDVGGTFTDFFAFGPEGVRTWKRLSTPAAPDRAVLEGLGTVAPGARVVHGSTVATNALIERRRPRTVLITTQGFRDILEIRRQERPLLYALEPSRRPHVVARSDVIEVAERLDHTGKPVIALADSEVERVVQAAQRSGGVAFAICLLFAFRNPSHERRLAAALRAAGLDVCASHEVLPEYREYERASTTAINAFLRPAVGDYLQRLVASIASLRVQGSNGGLVAPADAAALPVTMVLSGPAGGVLGALAVARAAGYEDVITFDMGGTSTDVALCEGGRPASRSAATIDGLALHTPMIDVVTVGAGGGSIARVDAGGAMVAGPESAGADPGPACYGRGTLPTVSDANLVLGRLRIEQPLAGALRLDGERARVALTTLGEPVDAARAVVRVVNVNMARALRAVSLERGFDARRFTLVAFGGAGPLHACDLADEVGIPRVLVPRHPGVLSALGMVTARETVELSSGLLLRLDDDAPAALSEVATALESAARERFAPVVGGASEVGWAADARYAGQAHELRVEVDAPRVGLIAAAFHAAHLRRFGYNAPGRMVELVALRVRCLAPLPPSPIAPAPGTSAPGSPPAAPISVIDLETGNAVPAALLRREALSPAMTFAGPAVVVQDDATTWVPPGWGAHVDAFANIVLERPL